MASETHSYEEEPTDASLRDPLPDSPLGLLGDWFREAEEAGIQPRPESMTLATAGPTGRPSARVVLRRGYDAERGFVVFYTNRRSRKGRQLTINPRAAAVFHWDALQRQVRLEGPTVPSPDEESDAYFARRPRASQIAAWASEQSEPIGSRRALLEKLEETRRRFDGSDVPRPPFWGGYRLFFERVELWVASPGRAHDRVLWTRELEAVEDGFSGGAWSRSRLQP